MTGPRRIRRARAVLVAWCERKLVLLNYQTLVSASAHVATYPAGQAVEVSAVTAGHASQVLLLPSGSQLWEIDILTAGSTRAKKQYPDLLRSLSLPRE